MSPMRSGCSRRLRPRRCEAGGRRATRRLLWRRLCAIGPGRTAVITVLYHPDLEQAKRSGHLYIKLVYIKVGLNYILV